MHFAILIALLSLNLAFCHIDNERWEPYLPIYGTLEKGSARPILLKLTTLRSLMASKKVDAYVIHSADPEGGQCGILSDIRTKWLLGVRGRVDSVVITAKEAKVWPVPQYFDQVFMEIDHRYFGMMKAKDTIEDYISKKMTSKSVVAIDPKAITNIGFVQLQDALNDANITLTEIEESYVDKVRTMLGEPAPPRNNALTTMSVQKTGYISGDKLNLWNVQVKYTKAAALVLSALEDIAYTLNLRGSDIPYTPVFFSYLVIRPGPSIPKEVILFWGNGTLSHAVEDHFIYQQAKVKARPYDDFLNYMKNLTASLPDNSTVCLTEDASRSLYAAVESSGKVSVETIASPVQVVRAKKTAIELEAITKTHVYDGIAMVKALSWLDKKLEKQDTVTEIEMSDKLEEMRMQEDECHGPSFPSTVAAGQNSAVLHYLPSREGPKRCLINLSEMLLIHSGGQYTGGTTDVTRTRCMGGKPSELQSAAFTLVMKGQIALSTAIFPHDKVTGHNLDILARRPLWNLGLDYHHDTGHGVGYFLNVHERPSAISSNIEESDPGIYQTMILTNEPGFYRIGAFGVSHGDIVEVIKVDYVSDHPLAANMVGNFDNKGSLGFHTLTLVPHHTACLNISMLNDKEIKYLNAYHDRVLKTLGPILKKRKLLEEYEWLKKECAPINNAPILGISGLLVSVTIFILHSNIM